MLMTMYAHLQQKVEIVSYSSPVAVHPVIRLILILSNVSDERTMKVTMKHWLLMQSVKVTIDVGVERSTFSRSLEAMKF